jgi:hypothetical protein
VFHDIENIMLKKRVLTGCIRSALLTSIVCAIVYPPTHIFEIFLLVKARKGAHVFPQPPDELCLMSTPHTEW